MIRSLPPTERALTSVACGNRALHRRSEPRDERHEVLAQRVEPDDRLEVESGAVGLAFGHEIERLLDEPILGGLALEEGGHLRIARCGVEELERRDDADAAVVGGVGHRRGIVAEVGLGADPAGIDGAVGLDADPEERDRRDELVVDPVDRARVKVPVRQVAVDLVGERLDAGDARPDLGGRAGRRTGRDETRGGQDRADQEERQHGRDGVPDGQVASHRPRKPDRPPSVQPPVGPGDGVIRS